MDRPTPGPWGILDQDVTYVDEDDTHTPGVRYEVVRLDEEGESIETVCTTEADNVADAHLIAAAPDMFRALSLALTRLRNLPNARAEVKACADAIAKALGYQTVPGGRES